MTTAMRCLFFFLILASFKTVAQDLPVKDGKVFYEVLDTSSKKKEILYTTAKRWLAKTFNDSKAVIESDDKEAGEIVGKAATLFSWNVGMGINRTDRCKFLIQINLKAGKYRLQISNLCVEDMEALHGHSIEDYNAKPDKGINKRLLPAVDASLKSLLQSFQFAMNANIENDF